MTENLNTGGSLRQIILPYPNFELGEIIDPYEHNANNSEMIIKINEMVSVLNSFINGEANTSLSAMAVNMPGVDPIEGTDLETFLRRLVGAIRSTEPGDSGAHFVQSAKIEGLPGENIWEQISFLSEMVTGINSETGETIDDEAGQDTTLQGKIEHLLRDFALHVSGSDHDLRYYTKEEIDNMLLQYLKKDGDFLGTWQGMTLKRVLSATGTGFGMIEILNQDPINPEPGRIWIITDQFIDNPFAPEPEIPEEGDGE